MIESPALGFLEFSLRGTQMAEKYWTIISRTVWQHHRISIIFRGVMELGIASPIFDHRTMPVQFTSYIFPFPLA
jgi:hypothetical protein